LFLVELFYFILRLLYLLFVQTTSLNLKMKQKILMKLYLYHQLWHQLLLMQLL